MNLKTPRENPYSSVNSTIEYLEDKGYTKHLEIQDEKTLTDGDHLVYHPEDLMIDEIHRITGTKNFVNLQVDVIGRTEIYALNAKNGMKGYVVRNSLDEGLDVLDTFMQNVSKHNEIKEY